MKYFILLYFILFIPVISSFSLNLLKLIKKIILPRKTTLLPTTLPPTTTTPTTTQSTTTQSTTTQSTTTQSTTTQSINTTKRPWQPWNISLNNSLVLRLGLRAVNRYNKKHKETFLTFINVTTTLKHGKICSGNKEVKLLMLVSLNYSNSTSGNKCQKFRTVYNVTNEGKGKRYYPKRYRLFNSTLKGECKQTVNNKTILANIKAVDKKKNKLKLSSTPIRETTKLPK
ncbi:Hypothetical protein SRAE_2000499400 [Strongyloides ratti]|uniref:Uncharacterized protein n=1 Tax=Strongyloides ratti TaxID=34506 RepID=A0A090LRZ6_STRRB|nr:Hypothetical protein SRAE_2000499400 [Strongyloides ratti]CEF70361.2 Hypothetical protein SRAE_2000499400 [Strongyloides ratti]